MKNLPIKEMDLSCTYQGDPKLLSIINQVIKVRHLIFDYQQMLNLNRETGPRVREFVTEAQDKIQDLLSLLKDEYSQAAINIFEDICSNESRS